MPKEIKDLREFVKLARRKDATKVKMIKTKELANGKASEVFKFKIRTARSLYTLKLHSKEKADKLKQALPPALDKIDLNAPA